MISGVKFLRDWRERGVPHELTMPYPTCTHLADQGVLPTIPNERYTVTSPEIVSVVGARPQFIKAAVVSRAFAATGIHEVIVHTGQHYDEAMSGRFLADLGMTNIVANLNVGSGSHAHQTARIMTGFQDYLESLAALPKAVLVYGDTNSTIGAGLVAAKLGIPLVHVEAGLRSYNRAMPEETNRVITDHISELLFCSSHTGVANLAQEGVTSGVVDVGDVMLDAFLVFGQQARAGMKVSRIAPVADEQFVLVTIHRPSNTDDPSRLQTIMTALGRLDAKVVWPVHPRNRAMLKKLSVPTSVICIEPVGYLEMLVLLDACRAVVTDSGGLQKEAHWAKRPCVTLRLETEWVETLEGGWNVLANPENLDLAELVRRSPASPWRMLYGDGQSSNRIAAVIAERLLNRSRLAGAQSDPVQNVREIQLDQLHVR